MPQLGEIRKAEQLGRAGRDKFIWFACSHCGKERWVRLAKDKPMYSYCRICASTITKQKTAKKELLTALQTYNPEFISLDDRVGDGSNLVYNDVIPDPQIDVERKVMAKFTFRALPKIIKHIGAKRLAGFSLTDAEQTYIEKWRANKMPAFRKEWQI